MKIAKNKEFSKIIFSKIGAKIGIFSKFEQKPSPFFIRRAFSKNRAWRMENRKLQFSAMLASSVRHCQAENDEAF